jgi:hypothetical protein
LPDISTGLARFFRGYDVEARISVFEASPACICTGRLSAAAAVEALEGSEVATGFCGGDFGLLALAGEALDRFGPADVFAATWSQSGHWVRLSQQWFEARATRSLRLALRPSTWARVDDVLPGLRERWGLEAPRAAESHAEVLVLHGDGWWLTATGSLVLYPMDLLQWWRLERRAAVGSWWAGWFGGLPVYRGEGRKLELPSVRGEVEAWAR